MGNSLRCCIACVLPCGALDLIRVVHLNGYVEEITRPITAAEFLSSYPNHVLSIPCSRGVVRRILILTPDAELKRGCIYFLIPPSSLPHHSSSKQKKKKSKKTNPEENNCIVGRCSASSCLQHNRSCHKIIGNDSTSTESNIITESARYDRNQHRVGHGKRCLGRDQRQHSRTASWLPHLDSIAED